jgi:CBS domain-containing protein
MHLSTCMRRPPVTCEMNATLAEVGRMMEFEEVGSVLVMTEDNHLAGIVTDRDLVVRGLAHECGPMTRIETIMSSPVITVHETQDPFEAAAKMARAACRREPGRHCHGSGAGSRVARRHHAAVHGRRGPARERHREAVSTRAIFGRHSPSPSPLSYKD